MYIPLDLVNNIAKQRWLNVYSMMQIMNIVTDKASIKMSSAVLKDKMFLPLGIPVVMTIERVFSRKDILLKHKRRSCKKEVLNREMSI